MAVQIFQTWAQGVQRARRAEIEATAAMLQKAVSQKSTSIWTMRKADLVLTAVRETHITESAASSLTVEMLRMTIREHRNFEKKESLLSGGWKRWRLAQLQELASRFAIPLSINRPEGSKAPEKRKTRMQIIRDIMLEGSLDAPRAPGTTEDDWDEGASTDPRVHRSDT